MNKLVLFVASVGVVGGCSSTVASPTVSTSVAVVAPSVVSSTTTTPPPSTTMSPTTTAVAASTTVAPTTTAVTTTTVDPDLVRRAFPVLDAGPTGWSDDHHTYPATDIFHPSGCGTALAAPIDGTVQAIRREDLWSADTDDPSARGGQYLSILGDDGVRYYMAHFQMLEASLAPGVRVTAGQFVGEMGTTGRSGACHLHFALSPPCPSEDWWVRRGVVWPYPYLEQWQQGVNASPVDEIAAWANANPDACTTPPGP